MAYAITGCPWKMPAMPLPNGRCLERLGQRGCRPLFAARAITALRHYTRHIFARAGSLCLWRKKPTASDEARRHPHTLPTADRHCLLLPAPRSGNWSCTQELSPLLSCQRHVGDELPTAACASPVLYRAAEVSTCRRRCVTGVAVRYFVASISEVSATVTLTTVRSLI